MEKDDTPIFITAGINGKVNEFSKTISNCLIGMSVNEIKHFKMHPKFAFGEWDKKKVIKTVLAKDSHHQVGDDLKIKLTVQNQAQILDGTIVKIDGEYAHVDTNHPLAGEALIVKIQVISFN